MVRTPKNVIGFILKGYPRLSETFIVNEIFLLEKLGYKLHIFALRNPGEAKVHETVSRVQAEVTYVPDYFWRFLFAFLSANIRLCARRPRLYLPAFRFAALRSLRRRSSSTIKRFTQAVYLVENCLTDTGVSHFHAHFSHGPTTVAFFAAWLLDSSYSFSAHAKDIYLQENVFLRQKIERAKFVVTCTEFNRRHLLKVAGDQAPIFRSYHGIDVQRFSPPHSQRQKTSCPVILSIGRFIPKKGFPVLLQALDLLTRQGIQFHAKLIGGGPLHGELSKLTLELGLQDRVELLPQMTQSELMSYYRQADMFVLACEVQKNGDRDGIPNVLVEAMAIGLPVISTAISGIPELIEHGVSGCLVTEKDPDALAARIRVLLHQPQMAERFGKAGRARIVASFDSKKNVKRIGELLSDALVGRRLENNGSQKSSVMQPAIMT